MKRALLVAMAVFMFVSLAFSGEFYGSSRSNKYHYPGCTWARKIKPSNLVVFTSPEQAVKAGYTPCKVCAPPLKSGAKNRNGFFSRFAGEEELER
jgi:methylphosphotriester-DNA--protein-cysteine methyltransferase